MEFAYEAGCGRSVVATRDYAAGETIHEEFAYAMAKTYPATSSTKGASCEVCVGCFSSVVSQKGASSSSARPCTKCNVAWYCSETCFAQYHLFHESLGECAVLAVTTPLRSKIPKEDFNIFQVICMVLARGYAEGASSLLSDEDSGAAIADSSPPASSATLETVGGETEDNLPSLEVCVHAPLISTSSSSSSRSNVPRPPLSATYHEMERLVTNRSATDPEILKDYVNLHTAYEKLIMRGAAATRVAPPVQDLSDHAAACSEELLSPKHHEPSPSRGSSRASSWWAAYLPPRVTETVFVALCCAFQANGFGLWNAKGNSVASGFFPCSSFFNHSCAPNVGREMHGRRAVFFAAKPIHRGDAICLSYIDFKLSREERHAKLKATYSFLCGCPRCTDKDAIDHRAMYDVPLCQECKSKIMRPLVDKPGFGVCPCCGVTAALTDE